MTEPKYSVREIEELRNAINSAQYLGDSGWYQPKGVEQVEQELRTYMLNGTKAKHIWDDYNALRKAHIDEVEARLLKQAGDMKEKRLGNTVTPRLICNNCAKLYGKNGKDFGLISHSGGRHICECCFKPAYLTDVKNYDGLKDGWQTHKDVTNGSE